MSGASGGPRIGVVGSCQTIGLGAAFRKMWPNAEVKTWSLNTQCPETPDAIAAQLTRCDLIVSQVRQADPAAPLAFQRLCEMPGRAVFVPVFVFNGFHPDIIYIKAGNTPVAGPFQLLHSAIIAACYVLDVPEARAARLFNALTYASLGYFDAFGTARRLLTASFAKSGYDLAPLIDDWVEREGAFMYTLNHPRILVLSRLAHMIAVRAGMTETGSSVPDGVEDFLAHNFLWPVYPELARKLSLPKSDMVVKASSRTLERTPAQLHKLPDTVGAFYAAYAQHDRQAFRAGVPARVVTGLEEMFS